MRKTLLVLCLLYPLVVGANERDAQRLSEIGSRSRLLCASAMAYFDPREREPDARGLTSVYHNLMALDTLVVQLGDAESLRRPLQTMRTVFETLEGAPRGDATQLAVLVRQLLEASTALQLAARDDAVSLHADPKIAQLGAQSQALPNPQPFALGKDDVQRLDAEITQRFTQLLTSHPQHTVELEKIDNTYRFVRAQLLQGNGHLSGGANFYLDRAISDLDDLAANLEDGSAGVVDASAAR